MLLENVIAAIFMVSLTIMVHFAGLTLLIALMRSRFVGGFRRERHDHGAVITLLVLLSIALLHTIEIWLFAALYIALGLFDSIVDAVYFSASTFSTVGFGDIVLDERWRLLAATEGAHGFLLIGWSTAFLVSVTARMGLLEARLGAPRHRVDPAEREGP